VLSVSVRPRRNALAPKVPMKVFAQLSASASEVKQLAGKVWRFTVVFHCVPMVSAARLRLLAKLSETTS
jgi:hypothetical protein